MDIIIMRHGESEADILKVMEGRADFSLTENGRSQAQSSAEWLVNNYKINKIFASPLRRAAQTAQAVSDKCGIEVAYDDDLMEWQNGLIAGLPYAEADERFPEPERFPHTAVYEQESFIAFRMRAETALSKIINENSMDETVLIVSHGGMISQLFRSMLGLPVTETFHVHTNDTGIHAWRVKEDGTKILMFANKSEHRRI